MYKRQDVKGIVLHHEIIVAGVITAVIFVQIAGVDVYKRQVQRIAIMNYLIEHRTHPTVDEIYTALSPSIPTLSKTCLLYTSRCV